jgi:uncharacterized membrane-anchored protein YjiN (DUF445 family)
MKHIKLLEEFLIEKKPKGAPDFYQSDAPEAEGRFKDLSIKDLAAWLIKTRKGDLKRISGSLTQQVVFNRKDDPKYAEKMEKTRKEVYKQLDRQDLIDAMDESVLEAYRYIPDYENEGYVQSQELIKSIRAKVYKKLSDIELEEFTRSMLDHFNVEIPKHLRRSH